MSVSRRFWLHAAACLLAGAGSAFAATPAAPAKAASAAKPAPAAAAERVRLSTTAGDIVIELDRAKAPKTVENFVQYVKAGQYNGTIFHRVIDGFMIQAGGMKPDMSEKPTRDPIPLESRNGLSNARGTIAMARTNDPNSATAQFFINVVDNARLDASPTRDGYAVFGKVVSGMEVVDKIRVVATGNKGMHQNVPLEPIVINKATLEK